MWRLLLGTMGVKSLVQGLNAAATAGFEPRTVWSDFPGMASACHQFVQQCRSCISASTRRGPSAAPTRPDIPGRPWSQCEVTLDTLELGPDRSGRYHCVLVCVDSFTKWAEVAPCVVMMRPPLLRRLRTSACVGDRRKWCVWTTEQNFPMQSSSLFFKCLAQPFVLVQSGIRSHKALLSASTTRCSP